MGTSARYTRAEAYVKEFERELLEGIGFENAAAKNQYLGVRDEDQAVVHMVVFSGKSDEDVAFENADLGWLYQPDEFDAALTLNILTNLTEIGCGEIKARLLKAGLFKEEDFAGMVNLG